ncbi:TonB-dependent receptor [bacterium BMS3Abin03]|nr:TonB-dependent receptor [bacterium BMS3Abin03]
MVQNFYCNKKLFSVFSILFFSLVGLSLTFAQTGTVRGTISDKITNEVLPGANAIIKGTSLGAATNLDGKFVIKNVPVGSQVLEISYIGYQSITVNINVVEGKTLEEEFYLEYQSIEGKTVTITAQAEGQLGAINQQLNTNTISNVVSKDRIKELPDVNAAETIGRLPGVSIQRYGGEATKVEIRGLSPKYSLITVNGIELPSTGTEDRSVDLSLVSSNMLDGIILRKTNTPDMDADVLGGTVELKLKEAQPGPRLSLSAQGGYNRLQDYYGNYNFTVSLSNRFFDDRLGIIVNGNVDNYDRSADKLQDNWRRYNKLIASGQIYLREEQLNRKRSGASILGDLIIPDGKITANAFFNQLNSKGLNHISQVNTLENGWGTNRHIYQTEQYKSVTDIYTSALGINQDLSWIRYDASISRSGTATSDPDKRVYEFTQEQSALLPGYPIGVSPVQVAKFYNADTITTNMSALYSYSTRTIENISSAKFNFKIPYKLNDQLSGYIKTGAKLRWIDRSNDQRQYGYSGLQYGDGSQQRVFTYTDEVFPEWGLADVIQEYGLLNIRPFLTNYNRANFLNGDYPMGFIVNEGMLKKMSDALINAPDSIHVWVPYSVGTFGYDYKGFERYEAAYLMGELNWGTLLTIIPGVRWEEEYTVYDGQRYRVNQSGQTAETPPTEFVKLNVVRRNKYWLPMLTLIVKPTDWLQVKTAVTQTLARPDYIRYAPISYISADSKQVTAANLFLKPSRSTNYDIGFSIYNNEIGLLAVNAFYKRVEDLIFYSAFFYRPGIEVDPNLELPSSWLASNPQINAYRNNPNPAKYYGFEIEWQTHFWYLPSVLSGLVLNVNYTHIYSEMTLAYDSLVTTQIGTRRYYSLKKTSIKTRMPDQPSHIFNITIGYDFEGFSARLSYLYQTDKLTGIGYDGVVPTSSLSAYTGGYGRLDLTLQQKLLPNLQLFANLNNLNNRHDQNFIGSNLTHPSYIEYYGLTMDLGVRYNLE